MKCVICKSGDIAERVIEEEIRVGSNIIFVSVKALVCPECGEKYYNRAQIKKLEDMEMLLRQKKVSLEKIGDVLRPVAV